MRQKLSNRISVVLMWAALALAVVTAYAAQTFAQSVPGHLKIVFTSDRDATCDDPVPSQPPVCPLDEYGELYIMNRNGSDQTRITFSFPQLGAAWSPDGTKIAYHTPVNGLPQIFLMNPDGSGQMQLTNFALGAQFPNWSPDGKKIVFQSNKRPRDIYVMSLVNGIWNCCTNLTSGIYVDPTACGGCLVLADDIHPAWSPLFPDGSSKIAFQSNRDVGDGNSEIYTMNPDGSDPIRLTYDFTEDQTPDWSPDATKIVFQSTRDMPAGQFGGDNNFEIYAMNADGTGPITRLTNNKTRDLVPKWSPDGTSIAFDSDRDDPPIRQVYVMNPDGTHQKPLTFLPGENGHEAWGWEADVER